MEKDIGNHGDLTVDEFKTFLIDTCGTAMLSQKLSKKDLEGFMSSFVYNTQGSTNLGDIADLVFTNDQEKVVRYLSGKRSRANPPPTFINQGLD